MAIMGMCIEDETDSSTTLLDLKEEMFDIMVLSYRALVLLTRDREVPFVG